MLYLDESKLNQRLRQICCRRCPRFHEEWYGRKDQCDTNTDPLECYDLRHVSDEIYRIDRQLFFAREETRRLTRKLNEVLS